MRRLGATETLPGGVQIGLAAATYGAVGATYAQGFAAKATYTINIVKLSAAFNYSPNFFGTENDFGNNNVMTAMGNIIIGIPLYERLARFIAGA